MLSPLRFASTRVSPVLQWHSSTIIHPRLPFASYRSFHPAQAPRMLMPTSELPSPPSALPASAHPGLDGLLDHLVGGARSFFLANHEQIIDIWAYSIPLSTLALRLLLYLCINVPRRGQAANMAAAQPLVTASTRALARLAKQPKRDSIFHFGGSWRDEKSRQANIWKQHNDLKQFRAAVKLRYGANELRWGALGLINLPIWFCMAEALRSMSGSPYGLLGLLMKGLGYDVQPGQVLHPEWVEESMATQGALWFRNLLVADPTASLSVILAACTSFNVYQSLDVFRRSEYYSTHFIYKHMIRLGPWLAFALIPMTWQFPAAILLYWTTSSFAATMAAFSASKKAKLNPTVKPLSTGLDSLGPAPLWLIEKPKKTKSKTSRKFGR